MSEQVNRSLPEVSEALAANGQDEFEEISGEAGDDFDEESDEYDDEVNDEEQDQYAAGEEEGEGANDKDPKQQNGLTALLLRDPNAEDEEDDEDDDDDDDEEYAEEVSVPATPSNKKRTIDEAGDNLHEESEAKKVKA